MTTPDKEELAQLALLRSYLHLATGAAVPNDFFIYEGTGSYGINIGTKAIGFNAALLKVSFSEAVSVGTHELAHNAAMDHGPTFMLTMQALFVTTQDRQRAIIHKLTDQQALTQEEELLVEIERQWDTRRAT